MNYKKKIVPNEGEFLLLMIFEVNFPLPAFSTDFLGHNGRVQCSLIGRELVIISKLQPGAKRREQTKKIQIYLGITMHR